MLPAWQAIVDKRRSAHNESEVMNLIGDVRGKVAVLVDDMIDTAGIGPACPTCFALRGVSSSGLVSHAEVAVLVGDTVGAVGAYPGLSSV